MNNHILNFVVYLFLFVGSLSAHYVKYSRSPLILPFLAPQKPVGGILHR